MRSRWTLGLFAIGAAVSGGGCTTVLYKGPSLPESQIAVLTSRDTMIDKVDSVTVRGHASGSAARFEILPGEHEVGISLNRVILGFFMSTVQRSSSIVVCVELEAGHTYRTEAVIQERRWVPQVLDVTAQRLIDPYCDAPEETHAAAPAPVTPPAPVASSAAPPPDGGAPAPVAAEEAAVAPAAPPVASAVDADQPRLEPAASLGSGASAAAQLSGRRPGSGLSLFFGFGFGGEDFVSASSSSGNDETLSSGTGVIFGAGGMLTPLWPTEGLGLGLGVDAAIKYDSIDAANGSASIRRFPLALTAHLLTNGSGGDHFFLLKGGVARDFGINYSASGVASIDANVEGTWGPTGALGYYKRTNDVFAWDVMGFFALTNHVIGTSKINANSVGLTMGFHLNL